MKLINFTALFILSVLFAAAAGVSEAKKFAPTSFVAKRQQTASLSKADADIEALLAKNGGAAATGTSSKAISSQLSLVSRVRGGISKAVTPELTFYMDIFWTVLVAVFMVYWLQSKQLFQSLGPKYVDEFPNFNTQVLTDGFCIAQDKSTTLWGLGTLKLCGIVDAILIVASYFIYKDSFNVGNNKLIYTAAAAYTVVHGAIHGFEVDQTGKIWDLANNSLIQNVSGVFLLALITLFTPIGIKDIFDQAKKPNGLLVGGIAWIGFVLYYMFGIQEKVYALTYINVTIFLSIFGTRALVFKKNDPERLSFYQGASTIAMIIAATANIIVMCFEPLACKDWFAGVGGHIWFDITLWLFLMSNMK